MCPGRVAQEALQQAVLEACSCKPENSQEGKSAAARRDASQAFSWSPTAESAFDTFLLDLLPPRLCRLKFCCLQLPRFVTLGYGSPGKVMKVNLISNERFLYFTLGSFQAFVFLDQEKNFNFIKSVPFK